MLLGLIDSLPSQAGEQCDTDTCYLNNKPKLDNLTLQPAFHVSVSRRPPWCHSLVCSPWLLYENFQRFADLPHSSARQVGVVFWSPRSSRGPNDAASRSPRVKGENSENRVFWSVREDLPAPFCMLEFGPGVMEGRWGWGQEYVRVKRPMLKERLGQLRTNNGCHSYREKRDYYPVNCCGWSDTYSLKDCCTVWSLLLTHIQMA